MKTAIALLLTCASMCAQTTPYMVQLLQKPNAVSARAYLGITNSQDGIAAGTNVVFTRDFQGRTVINAASGGAGSGTVTSVSSGNANPLFTVSVANPTTTPAFTYSLNYTPLSSNDVAIVNALGTTPVNNATSAINAGTATNVVGGVIQNVTNAGQGNITLISTSNNPTVSLKSLTAGANVTLTDQGGTNIQIASTGGGGGGLDYLSSQTNSMTTIRSVNSDTAEGGTVAFNGFGDTLGFSFTAGGAAILTHRTALPLGQWAESRTTTTSTAVAQLGSQTANAVIPYAGYTFKFQTFVSPLNTNSIRIIAGAMAANTITADNFVTNLIMFRYSTVSNDVDWIGVCSDGTTTSYGDTGAKVLTNATYLLSFVKSGTSVTFSVNHTNTVTVSSSVPNAFAKTTDAMFIFQGHETLATGAKTNLIRYVGYDIDWPNK